MADLTDQAQQWLADHHGVITTSRLRASGVGRTTLRRLIERGVLRVIDRGVFVITSTPVTLEQRCAIICATHPSGFVTGPTAGTLAGLRRMPMSAPVHFSIRHGLHLPRLSGVHLRQTTALRSSDRSARHDGILVASSARLAFDLAADLRPLDHLSAVEQLLHERSVTSEQLVAIGRRLAHPARPGSGQFLRTLMRIGGSSVDESHPEVLLADALERRGIPIERQTRLLDLPNGRSARIDLGVRDVRWGVELDIHPEHRSFEGFAYGASRVRQLHLVGWQVEQVTEPDMADVEALADELVRLYRARRADVRRDPPDAA